MQRILLLIPFIFFLFLFNPSFSQLTNEQQTFLQNFRVVNEEIPRERIYVHTDRQWYYHGDRIWFSVYATSGSNQYRSGISRVLYVDLHAPSGERINRVVKRLDRGRAHGSISFDEHLVERGTYQLRAYTLWGFNFGESYIFNKNIEVYTNEEESRRVQRERERRQTDSHEIDLQFLPEGGQLIAGVPNRVAFKAVGKDGLHRDVFGFILNSAGETVAEFESIHNGMGSFSFTPQDPEGYTANAGRVVVELPTANETGMNMKVTRNADQFIVQTRSSGIPDNQDFTIFAHVRGAPYHVARIPIEDGLGFSFIPASLFPTGIVHFTVLSPDGRPVTERLAFNKNNVDDIKPRLIINNAEVRRDGSIPSFKKREDVPLRFFLEDHTGNTIGATASVSVFDDTIHDFNFNASNILAGLYLEPEINGFIEDPGFYFSNHAKADEYLDLLLMTQGWRAYNMNIFSGDAPLALNHNPEFGFTISGQVFTQLWSRPVAEASVVVSHGTNQEEMYLLETDREGRFFINNLDFELSEMIQIRANTQRGRDNVTIVLDEQFQVNPSDEPKIVQRDITNDPATSGDESIADRATASRTATERHFDFQMEGVLEDVIITADRIREDIMDRNVRIATPGSQSVNMDDRDWLRTLPLEQVLTQIPGVTSVGSEDFGQRIIVNTGAATTSGTPDPLLYIDGVQTDMSMLWTLTSDDVQTIDVYRRAHELAAFGSVATGGVISITTRRNLSRPDQSRGFLRTYMQGYHPPTTFYSPRYGFMTPELEALDDQRITLHWEPDLTIGPNGGRVLFWTNDVPSRYRIVLQGITDGGQPFKETFLMEVTD